MVNETAVAFSSGANRGQSPAYRSSISTAVTTLVVRPVITDILTQSYCLFTTPYLWSNQRTNRDVENPEESTMKPLSIERSGLAASAMRPLRTGVIAGSSRNRDTRE